ncbi:DgyrCDS1383 [Dimorphilus gyrociliatus]|uniref:ADP-ribosylhydrolase ARH1 n=1 Tax=Dimorphilus gyrociliatus TaxID=2664684 RepID=A0A7I8V8M8_9ANNE|nr:DgyrCDS1383 [Dimorphilus gyrociliatus]
MSYLQRFKACLVLSGVGDAMGYYNGKFEFEKSGSRIHSKVNKLGGLENLQIKLPSWMVSDDTVMHIATAKALIGNKDITPSEKLYLKLVEEYANCMSDMNGRAPGNTCMSALVYLQSHKGSGYKIPFNQRGAGCGAAMRSMCLGLVYQKPEQLDDLIKVSIEAGRITHNHPIGYLGSLVSALFTAYAINGKVYSIEMIRYKTEILDVPIKSWGHNLLKVLPMALEYVKSEGRDVEENTQKWHSFEDSWRSYLKTRQILDGENEPVFPNNYDVDERDEFYTSLSISGWAGSCGHDAPMIAYDALLKSKDNWLELCLSGVLHGGDNDSTGAIAGAWYGALYAYKDVPKNHYKNLEYRDVLKSLATSLYKLQN